MVKSNISTLYIFSFSSTEMVPNLNSLLNVLFRYSVREINNCNFLISFLCTANDFFNLHVFYLTQEKLKKERLTSIRLSKMCIDII